LDKYGRTNIIARVREGYVKEIINTRDKVIATKFYDEEIFLDKEERKEKSSRYTDEENVNIIIDLHKRLLLSSSDRNVFGENNKKMIIINKLHKMKITDCEIVENINSVKEILKEDDVNIKIEKTQMLYDKIKNQTTR
jgi:hypothetical protein